jgi:HD-GYP domain-containing protein (c-di-GMP phosphodiesterase class II)
VATVFVLGLAALVDALYTLQLAHVPYVWVALALLTIGSDSVKAIKIPGLTAHLSPSEIFLFLIVLLFGGAPAVVTLAMGGLTFSLRQELLRKRHRQYHHAAFDLAEPALSIWAASKVYVWLGGADQLWATGATLAHIGMPALAMSAVYFAMNSGLNAVAEAGATGASPFPLWRKYFQDVSINYVSNASVAVVLAVNLPSGDALEAVTVLAVVIPLVLAPYYNLALSTGRLEDQNRHMGEIEEYNLRLAETLGMTAEAKDRATSRGHIRRVKKFATRLADAMGVADPQAQKAIKFAGLLHDYGKTGIPDHILNKPGKLSAGEYEVIKTHPAIGADMVSTIGFNFPVVPIIRHHHENWDGTGYPDRLQGDAIPIGARILSVVDCYDALRDHRPYRRGLSHEEAMAIVRERAGTMYDPTVVRAFESIQDFVQSEPYDEAAAETPASAVPAAAAHGAKDDGAQPLPIEQRLADTAVLLRLSEDLSRLPAASGVDEACSTVCHHLLRLAPASLVVFFRRDEAADELAAAYASGFGEALVQDLRMPLGHKVSGWVAANGRSVINADSALDLDDRLDGLAPRFKSLLSVPLVHAGAAVGVVTLYALRAQAFREDQRQALELVSGAIAEAFERGLEHDRSRLDLFPSQELAGVASRRSLDELLARDRRRSGDGGRSRAVLCLKNDGDPGVMLHAMMAVSHSTRIADLIFRPTEDSLVVLMKDADATAEGLLAQRIAAALPADILAPPLESSPLRLGFACSPRDGEYWSDLLSTAQHRAWRTPDATAAIEAVSAPHGQRGLPWKA